MLVIRAHVAAEVLAHAAEEIRAVAEALPRSTSKAARATLLTQADRLADIGVVLARELDRPEPSPNLLRRIAQGGSAAAAALSIAALSGAVGGAAQAWSEHAISAANKAADAVADACAAVNEAAAAGWDLTILEPNEPQETLAVEDAARVRAEHTGLELIVTPRADGVDIVILNERSPRVRHLVVGTNEIGHFNVEGGIAFVDGLEIVVAPHLTPASDSEEFNN